MELKFVFFLLGSVVVKGVGFLMGVGFFWIFVVANYVPILNTHWVPNMFLNFPMCSPNMFTIAPHFIPCRVP